jgi:hypothetical protein
MKLFSVEIVLNDRKIVDQLEADNLLELMRVVKKKYKKDVLEMKQINVSSTTTRNLGVNNG